jgi:hypothetical protein
MSFFTNQTFQRNGDAVVDIRTTTVDKATALVNSQGHQDFSTLSTWYNEDPLNNHMKLQSYFGQQSESASLPLFQDVIKHDAILELNGWATNSKFTYDLPIETDTHMKTVDDTSDQQYCGADGSTFRIVLNRELAPFSSISCQGMDGDILVISEAFPVRNVGIGYEHYVTLAGSEQDPDAVYPSHLLKKDIQYFEIGSSALAEYSEKLSLVHMPQGTNYMTCEFYLGNGQGVETFVTGMADSVDLRFGSTHTKDYIKEIEQMYKKGNEVVLGMQKLSNGAHKYTIGSIMEMLAIQKFERNMNTSLMFQKGFTQSTSKGFLRFNEGLWRQMRRGFIITYGKRGGITLEHIKKIRDYVFKANPTKDVKDSIIRFKAGTEAFNNIDTLIQREFNVQLQQIAPLLGSDRVTPVNPVSGDLYNLKLELIRAKTVNVPGIGWIEVMEDKSMNYINVTDKNLRGMNPNGMDYTTYSAIIWDANDQTYSNNGDLPKGVTKVGNDNEANIYMVAPRANKVYWGTENGRYSMNSATDILASARTMHTSFFIYGFGAMWLRDPSKFVMLELEQSARLGYK